MPPTYRDEIPKVTLLPRCRTLRRESTDAEQALWRLLRGRQVAGAKFRRQHQFGPFILDFFCAEHNLAIEADGGQHSSPEEAAKDAARTRFLEERGVRVLRFTNLQILQERREVLEGIARVVERR